MVLKSSRPAGRTTRETLVSNEDFDHFNINLKIRTHQSTKHAQKTVYYESQLLKNDVAAIMSNLIELSPISPNICILGPNW